MKLEIGLIEIKGCVRIVAEFTLEVAERLSPEILVMAMMSVCE
jgi:hypothetical protein